LKESLLLPWVALLEGGPDVCGKLLEFIVGEPGERLVVLDGQFRSPPF
jgi:hypothetical protein